MMIESQIIMTLVIIIKLQAQWFLIGDLKGNCELLHMTVIEVIIELFLMFQFGLDQLWFEVD